MRQLFVAGCFLVLLFVGEGCSTVPRYQAEGELFGETVSTTVDSEIARYYMQSYLKGKRSDSSYDQRIDRLYKKQGDTQPTREDLKEITQTFSVDFATLFLADRLWAKEENRELRETFNRFLEKKIAALYCPPSHSSSYIVLFVPGWDYAEHGHLTGADLVEPIKMVTDLGIENHLIAISPHGSVEENAKYITKELLKYSKTGKSIIITGPSSAGAAIHLSLGEQLDKDQLRFVKAWVNLGGLLKGTYIIEYLYEWPRNWLLQGYMWMRGWDDKELLSMAVGPSRKRFERLSVPKDIFIINYLGFPLSGQLSLYSRDKYPLLAPEGPNDGLTLLADAIAPNSLTIVALGWDHFLAEDPQMDEKTVALTKTVISYLENESAGCNLNE